MHWWLQEAGVGLGGRMNEGVRRYKLQVGGGGRTRGAAVRISILRL